jgi:sugar/nucleoside kinase (ribokinase family)
MSEGESKNPGLIAGIGSALIDILAKEEDTFLNSISEVKGGMTLVENSFLETTVDKLTGTPSIVPGGAACNIIIGLGKLGADARFIGKCGNDEFGDLFRDDLKKSSVEPHLFSSDDATGRVLSIITPDAQRSMFTHLGASAGMLPEEVSVKNFEGATIAVMEAYLLFNPDLIMSALKAAKEAGAKIAMDLASFTVVEESRDILDTIVKEYVDILIANEDEAFAFTGHRDESEAINALASDVDIAVLKVGKKGSYISKEGKVVKIAPLGNGDAVDTTGAGDLWASGFLYGVLNGLSLEKSGEIGSACGYEVCQVIGASIPEDGWDRIKKLLNN